MPKVIKYSLLFIVSILLCSCRSETPSTSPNNDNQIIAPVPSGKEMKLESRTFQEGGMIPKECTCDGANLSPQLAWDSVPKNTKSFALIMDDPDAPGKTWTHWIIFNLPPGARELPENAPAQETIPSGGRQGTNDFQKVGYGGPCPPSGAHRYYFKLYALDSELSLDSSATKGRLLTAIEGHVLATGQLMGKYQR